MVTKPRHDHRQSLWIMTSGGNAWAWCYQCGAWKREGERGWNKPTGIGGPNPAMRALPSARRKAKP